MSNKEIEDLKTLIKSLDIRLRNEEISNEEYTELKTKYENQLKEQVAIVKEKSVLKDMSYISISGSGKVTDSFISISGSGRVEGWKGGSISISGSGKITEDEINVSGSGSLPGNLETHTVRASGSLKVNGPLESHVFVCSGSCKIGGYLVAHESLAISGSAKIESDVRGGSVKSSGSIKVDGSVLCVDAELNGVYKIDGNVECQESFTSELESKCTIKGDLLCSGDVHIEQGRSKGRLSVERIIAEGNVYLEGVNARFVSGKKVELGSDCIVDRVEEKDSYPSKQF